MGKRGRFTTELVECALQLLREVLKIAGERKVRRQVLQLAVENNQGAEAKVAERGLGDGRRHKRMSIPVSPDPSAEADFGHSQGICNQRGIKACAAPGFTEAVVKARQSGRKNLAQVINNSTAFRSDIRLFEQNFTGPPQAFQNDFELLAQGLLLVCRERLTLAGYKQTIERAVLLKDGRAFRFSGMRSENRFDAESWQKCSDIGRRHAGSRQLGQAASPEAQLRFAAGFDFTKLARACGRIFLDHVEQLKRDRCGLLKAFTARLLGTYPWQAVGHCIFSQLPENFLQATHEKIEVVGYFFETLCDIMRRLFHPDAGLLRFSKKYQSQVFIR